VFFSRLSSIFFTSDLSQFFCNRYHNSFFTYKASLALGDFYDTAKGLPLQKTKRVQRAIGLFFAVCRASEWDEATEKDVEVQITPKITTKIVANFT
jgi:hypothetical protein